MSVSHRPPLHRSKPCAMLSKRLQQHCSEKILFNVVQKLLGQHCTTVKNLLQCCPRNSRQHCTEKILFNVVQIVLGHNCTAGKNLLQCCPRGSRQHLTEKILFNVVLILFEQHCTGKNLVKCWQKGSRQHCTWKNPAQFCINTLGTTLCTGKNLVKCCQIGPRQHCRWKIQLNVVVILLGQCCTGKNPVQCYPKDSRQHYTGNPVHCCLNNITFLWFLFWTGWFFDNSRLLQKLPALHNFSWHCTRKKPGPTLNKKTRLYGTN